MTAGRAKEQDGGSASVRSSEGGPFEAVVIGASAGGLAALLAILPRLPREFPWPILLVQHLHKADEGRFAEHIGSCCELAVSEARDKEPTEPGHLYVAPADYHLLVEHDRTLALSVDPKVNWARPSIDVLFESAARAYGPKLVAIILSGANDDGAHGMQIVAALGGRCLAQDPSSAECPTMPAAAIRAAAIDTRLPPEAIGELLLELTRRQQGRVLHEAEGEAVVR